MKTKNINVNHMSQTHQSQLRKTTHTRSKEAVKITVCDKETIVESHRKRVKHHAKLNEKSI